MINVADIVCPDDAQGRTYRQINAAKTHTIPVGTLVETSTGVRLFVVWHGRDCDQEPLYYLSHDKYDREPKRQGMKNPSWTSGYPEEVLKIVG